MTKQSKVIPGSSESDPDRAKIPTPALPYYDAIVALTDPICLEHLDAEYALLCRQLAATLCRKRPPPITRGRIVTWACGIAYAICWSNHTFYSESEHRISATDLCALFGVGTSTGASKSAEIRKMVKMHELDPKWTRPSQFRVNPMLWMIRVNGFHVDARQMPREVQEEAFRKGLIPFLPEDPGI